MISGFGNCRPPTPTENIDEESLVKFFMDPAPISCLEGHEATYPAKSDSAAEATMAIFQNILSPEQMRILLENPVEDKAEDLVFAKKGLFGDLSEIDADLQSFASSIERNISGKRGCDDLANLVFAKKSRFGDLDEIPIDPGAGAFSEKSGDAGTKSKILPELIRLSDHPIACQWDKKGNKGKRPEDFLTNSGTRVSWICPEGHKWKASINKRCKSEKPTGCSECNRLEKIKSIPTLDQHELASQFHPTLNGEMKPENFLTSSHERVFWQCRDNPDHTWKAAIKTCVLVSFSCPHCKDAARPRLSEHLIVCEFHPDLNGDKDPKDIKQGSDERVFWRCSINPDHPPWSAKVADRCRLSKKNRKFADCPTCKTQSKSLELRLIDHPVMDEWDYESNIGLNPEDYTQSSGSDAWWRCKEKHDPWKARINLRCLPILANSCPTCRKNQKKLAAVTLDKHPVAKEYHPEKNGDLKSEDLTLGSTLKVYWRCEEGHEWQASVQNRCRNDHPTRCPRCVINNRKAVS